VNALHNMNKSRAYTEEGEKFKAKNIKLWNSKILHFSFYVLHFSVGGIING